VGPRPVAGIAIAFAALVACSLGNFSGYSDGDDLPDSGSSDAPAATDGGNDGDSAPNVPNDASGDAPPEASQKFCEANADAGYFCEDFEGPSPLTHFTGVKTVNGTLTVEVGTMIANAPPAAAEGYVYGTASAKATGSHAQIAFSVQPEILNTTTANANQMAKIYFLVSGKAAYEVGVGLKGANLSTVYAYEYTEGGTYKEFGELPALASGKMTRFVVDARIDDDAAPGARLNVYRDGVRVVTDALLSPTGSAGAIEAYIGLPYLPPNHGAWKLRYDDILVGLPP
jgi:hypothetical protein